MKCKDKEGFAAKYYFVEKDYGQECPYKKEPWYFGDMSREEAEHLLGDNANPDGERIKTYRSFKCSFKCRWHSQCL